MTARVLVVDDLLPNVKLLDVRLSAEYFDVLTALNGPDALAIAERGDCDIILLDVMMPGMDGYDVCRRLKANPKTEHLPVIMVTALDQPADRLKGLEAGADDFLTKPIKDVSLVARVKSLVRLKMLTDELRNRALVTRELGIDDPVAAALREDGCHGRILLVDDRASSSERLAAALRAYHTVDVEADPNRALLVAPEGDYELAMVSLGLSGFDGLRLCSQLRSLERTRKLPLLVLADIDEETRVVRGLELGVNDYLMRPIDRNEMLARVRTQIRRKRYTDRLTAAVDQSLAAAVTDPLTGLNNRRFMQSRLATLLSEAVTHRRALSLLLLDIDHFKSINDTLGHEAGDEVLKELATRLRKAVRGVDIICRTGGEEFVVIMPETDPQIGLRVAERIRLAVEETPFTVDRGSRHVRVTLSAGLAGSRGNHTTADSLLRRADEALYRAKRDGRNRVIADAA